MYAALLDDFDGVRLIPPERLAEATALSTIGVDEVFGMPTAWGLGYAIGLPGSTAQDKPTASVWAVWAEASPSATRPPGSPSR